ncbi:hypothetical protein [Aquimarina sp. 2201CG5-10]|uniref:hypothetical protein n=1 Tax=Aquimarina callyspongiae TaxID=3098150 RepID=UPI002AB4422D|nr:hypothetical protein [Aquimarina sp. 2201CG5-10]MDY8136083.1 hypothetical protein [Aquimarina sp. 2201CG5-10]
MMKNTFIPFKIKHKFLKIIYVFTSILFIMSSCNSYKKVTGNDIFSVNSIQADKDYYTKAVLEYHFINQVFKDFSTDNLVDCVQQDDKKKKKSKKYLKAVHKVKQDSLLLDCEFIVPSELDDLESGFQYRYYSFSSNNSAALQAFGITDIEHNSETKYLVIDYIQFKDYACSRIPTIRYAVGLRSELKIKKSNIKAEVDLTKKGLAELAAKVELGEASINFSLKTIGLTGKPARLNIPQGVSFNVTTYKNYQNAIEFLKSNLQDKVDEDEKGENLVINPELIPVMDEYRPNTKNTIDAVSKNLIRIHKEIEKVKKKFKAKKSTNISTKSSKSDNKVNGYTYDINVSETGNEIIKLYKKEIERLLTEQDALQYINEQVYSIQQYKDFLIAAIPFRKSKQYQFETDRKELKEYSTTTSSDNQLSMFGFFPGREKLNTLNPSDLQRLQDIFYTKNSLEIADFNRFLNIINNIPINNNELQLIVEKLEKKADPNKEDLVNIANEIEEKRKKE